MPEGYGDLGGEHSALVSGSGFWGLLVLGLYHPWYTEATQPHSDLICNLRVLLESQLLIKEQVAIVATKAFELCVGCICSWIRRYYLWSFMLWSPPTAMCCTWGYPWRLYRSFCINWCKMRRWGQFCVSLECVPLLYFASYIDCQFTSGFNSRILFWPIKPWPTSSQLLPSIHQVEEVCFGSYLGDGRVFCHIACLEWDWNPLWSPLKRWLCQ